jgi:hypothetical protein
MMGEITGYNCLVLLLKCWLRKGHGKREEMIADIAQKGTCADVKAFRVC